MPNSRVTVDHARPLCCAAFAMPTSTRADFACADLPALCRPFGAAHDERTFPLEAAGQIGILVDAFCSTSRPLPLEWHSSCSTLA
jgi:hypothetical protein